MHWLVSLLVALISDIQDARPSVAPKGGLILAHSLRISAAVVLLSHCVNSYHVWALKLVMLMSGAEGPVKGACQDAKEHQMYSSFCRVWELKMRHLGEGERDVVTQSSCQTRH